ncbi:Wzz/FepE/Etk N-terminal domain-containing protein [Paraburkholderia phenazinium]|nr:Wzz/FepE/Etk N-terminal domain-containing protein [Paraburkholderia phenazinium]
MTATSKNSPDILLGMHQTPTVASRSHTHLLRHFAKSIKLIILTTVVGALIGTLISQFQHPRWLAKMTVQIGQVTMPEQASQPIESQLSATDRYNLPASRLLVLSAMGLPTEVETNRDAKLIFNSLRATPAKGLDLIELEASGYSQDEARAALVASFNVFSAEHQKKFEPALEEMKRELDSTSAKLAAVQADSDRTYESIRSGNTQGSATGNNSHDILLTNTATLINEQIAMLNSKATQLREAISPLRTYPTRILVAPYVPQRPSTPSGKLLIAVGAALGLLVGAAFAALRNPRRV